MEIGKNRKMREEIGWKMEMMTEGIRETNMKLITRES